MPETSLFIECVGVFWGVWNGGRDDTDDSEPGMEGIWRIKTEKGEDRPDLARTPTYASRASRLRSDVAQPYTPRYQRKTNGNQPPTQAADTSFKSCHAQWSALSWNEYKRCQVEMSGNRTAQRGKKWKQFREKRAQTMSDYSGPCLNWQRLYSFRSLYRILLVFVLWSTSAAVKNQEVVLGKSLTTSRIPGLESGRFLD